MCGWWITIYAYAKPPKDGRLMDVNHRASLASWKSGVNGLVWLNRLKRAGKARQLLSNGYPNLYTAKAAKVLPLLTSGGIHPPGWMGKVETSPDRIAACEPDQVLTIEAWDQS